MTDNRVTLIGGPVNGRSVAVLNGPVRGGRIMLDAMVPMSARRGSKCIPVLLVYQVVADVAVYIGEAGDLLDQNSETRQAET